MTVVSPGDLIEWLVLLVVGILAARHYRDRCYPARLVYATFWPRLFAAVIDECVLWPLGLVAGVFDMLDELVPLPTGAFIVAVLIPGVLTWVYFIAMHARHGQTVGKAFCRVRVVDATTGRGIGWRQALLRESIPALITWGSVGYYAYLLFCMDRVEGRGMIDTLVAALTLDLIVTAVLLGWQVLEVVTMLLNPQRRALHDFIAGTVVVRTNIEFQLSEPPEE